MTTTTERGNGYGYADLSRLMGRMTGDEKHGPAATSALDALWVLYDRVLRVTPERVDDPGRDRFLLSKGHGPMAYYAVLAAKGFLPVGWLEGFGAYDSPLGHHPDRVLGLGVGRAELRRYGQIDEHIAAHGLDVRSLRERITDFLGARHGLSYRPV
ncbi:hypothetical protein ACFQ7F_01560 [Streptomyces sp. NPDC056486]|uniref:hypothetical protein n=1 Tax=Streptomyces sp. NPDC056486 TaxID=3345835 RepID=UPI0036C41510